MTSSNSRWYDITYNNSIWQSRPSHNSPNECLHPRERSSWTNTPYVSVSNCFENTQNTYKWLSLFVLSTSPLKIRKILTPIIIKYIKGITFLAPHLLKTPVKLQNSQKRTSKRNESLIWLQNTSPGTHLSLEVRQSRFKAILELHEWILQLQNKVIG